jgi:hypothetical protein
VRDSPHCAELSSLKRGQSAREIIVNHDATADDKHREKSLFRAQNLFSNYSCVTDTTLFCKKFTTRSAYGSGRFSKAESFSKTTLLKKIRSSVKKS